MNAAAARLLNTADFTRRRSHIDYERIDLSDYVLFSEIRLKSSWQTQTISQKSFKEITIRLARSRNHLCD
ncbi:MAG: hypothetical protein CMJ78_19395 [Planctomycetaceae bacterium]|nr:hypothetical protein [Planctomycetaceae bacterium]